MRQFIYEVEHQLPFEGETESFTNLKVMDSLSERIDNEYYNVFSIENLRRALYHFYFNYIVMKRPKEYCKNILKHRMIEVM